MFFLDELNNLKIYKKQFIFPINDKDKRRNSVALLMTPSYESSMNAMKYPLLINRYFKSYYIERSAMYYINDNKMIGNESIVEESTIDKLIETDNRIIYRGYDNDIVKVMKSISPTYVKDMASSYKVSIDYPVTVEVYRKKIIPISMRNVINVSAEGFYNSSLKNYKSYLKYCTMEFILNNIHEDIPKPIYFAICLYESGLYDIHRSNWIFSPKLKVLCEAISIYINRYSHDKFVKDVIYKDPSKLFGKTIKDFIMSDFIKLKNILGFVVENYDMVNPNEDMGFQNEVGLLQIGEDCVLLLHEDSSYNTNLKRILYSDRIKNIKEVKIIYDKVKEDYPMIKYTYNTLERYSSNNLFIDYHKYNESYIRNNTFKLIKAYNIYFELMKRLITDERIKKNNYKKKTVVIPILDWFLVDKADKMWMIQKSINPISCIYQTMLKTPDKLKSIFGDTTFIFTGSHGYFKINFDTFDINKDKGLFLRNIKLLLNKSYVPEDDAEDNSKSSPKARTIAIVDKIEKSQGIEINDVSKAKTTNIVDKDTTSKEKIVSKELPVEKKVEPEASEKSKNEKDNKDKLVEKISKSSQLNTTEDEVIDDLDNDDELKKILADLSEDPDLKSNISSARASRVIQLQNDLMDKEFKGKPLREILDTKENKMERPLPVKELNLDTVNEEWKELRYCNSFDAYRPDDDIVKIFASFSEMEHPLSIVKIEVEDASTSEDVVERYTVQYEDEKGKRSTIKLDIPKFIDNRYLKLRGNRKDISSQLFLMPICKTDTDTVQIVSNYKKIIIRTFGTTPGKSINSCGRLMKTLDNDNLSGIEIFEGDNTRICYRYELPIDYVDFAASYNKIITTNYEIYFNQDELRGKFRDKIDLSKGLPFGYDKKNKSILYFNSNSIDDGPVTFSYFLALALSTDPVIEKQNFWKMYDSAPMSVRYTYSKASIMSTEIPLIVVCAYSEGLIKVLKKGNIKYRLEESKRGINKDTEDAIKFNDGYLIYRLDYASSLLMNGLKHCNTSSYSVAEINDKGMYLDFLDQFGGRQKSDGLDNFYNLMIDKPITYDALKYYKLPTDYIEILLYANRLLADNKFTKHTSIIDNRRIRRNEQIPAILYGVLSAAYGQYCYNLKHGRNLPMSLKQTAVIDETLINCTTTDKSILNALNEYEAYSTVTPKGPSGLNSERSYTLDKRSFDDSMLNILGMSTGFAANVGISRQATIDANISTPRGYITNKEVDHTKLSATKSFCMTESLTPYGTTRDDPFRSAMTFIQTSKHLMRCKRSNPGLITTGADEALPYLISNTFAKKADQDGKVVEVDENKLVLEYKDGTHDYIDLNENVEKNSSSGFYVTLKLDTDLKKGKTFKKGSIVAYDKSSFSSDSGSTDNLAYNIGTLAKIAILNTDEGFEDSAIISEDLCDDMTSNIVLMCPNHPIVIPKDTNIYNLVKKGQKIEEGDTLLTIQRPYDEEDANTLLKNLVGDPDEITNLGRIPIKSKVTGIVQDIVIYRTVDLDELSPSLKKVVKEYEANINTRKKEMNDYGITKTDYTLGSTDKLPPTGKLKKASDGVVIEIYLKYEDKMKIGDKLVYYSALKGVVKDIFPEGEEPKSEYRPNEKIHSLLALGGVNGRMVGSVLINGAIYKYLIELSRKCKDILGIDYPDDLFGK